MYESSDTMIVGGRPRRRCCGRNGTCEREATEPAQDPEFCRSCARLSDELRPDETFGANPYEGDDGYDGAEEDPDG